MIKTRDYCVEEEKGDIDPSKKEVCTIHKLIIFDSSESCSL
jgi:hypothetical protein